jgi:P pilus assembly chaperone PapD
MLETQESAPFVKWTSIPLTPIIIIIIIIIIVIRAFARIVPGSTKLIHTISKRKAAVVMDNPTNTQYNAQSIG